MEGVSPLERLGQGPETRSFNRRGRRGTQGKKRKDHRTGGVED
jgi:hypothetical protein